MSKDFDGQYYRKSDLFVDYYSGNRGGRTEFSDKEEYKIVDQFDSSYWSGLHMDVYLGKVHMPEIIQMSYQIVETVKPYWGYASYIPHRLHHGSRIVQGEFSLNFKRFGYMFSLLRVLREKEDQRTAISDRGTQTLGSDGTWYSNPVVYANQPWGPDSNTKLSTEQFNGDQLAKYVKDRKRSQYLNEGAVNAYAPRVARNAGMYEVAPEGFNVSIVFGGNIPQPVALRFVSDSDAYTAENGVVEDPAVDPHIIGTGLMLMGVSIMSNPVTINDDGRPVMETYSFMAKDVRPMTPREIGRNDKNRKAAEQMMRESGGGGKRITPGTKTDS